MNRPVPTRRPASVFHQVLGLALFAALIAASTYALTAWVTDFRSASREDRGDAPLPPPLPSSASLQEKCGADLEVLFRVVRERWSYRALREAQGLVDLWALESAARERLASAALSPDLERAFLEILRRFVAGLWDGHAGVDGGPRETPGPLLFPFTLADVREGIVVHGVHDSARAGDALLPGDRILAIDGVEIEAWNEERAATAFASTAPARRNRALRSIHRGTSAAAVTVRRQREQQSPMEVELACVKGGTPIPTPLLPLWRPERRILENGVGYLRPASFVAEEGAAQELRAHFESFQAESPPQGIRALILDLRDNPGGTDLLGQALVRHLIDRPVVYYELSRRRGDAWPEPMPHEIEPDDPRFLGPLVCLINEGTFSVADNVAACLRATRPQTTFIGRPTGGGTGAPRVVTLPNTRVAVRFCTMRVRDANHDWIEGRGTLPDRPVTWCTEDLFNGRDPDREDAWEFLSALLGR